MREQPHYTDLLTEAFFMEHYIQARKSFPDISRMLKEQGHNIAIGTVYKYAKALGIGRTVSEGMRNTQENPLDYTKTFLTESMIESVDGFLLGDGCIRQNISERFKTGRAQCSLQHKQFADYLMSGFTIYEPHIKDYVSPSMSSGVVWCGQTKFHPDLYEQWERWYKPNETKQVPNDVRITPKSVMMWYLGDGSLTQSGNTAVVRLSTDGFDQQGVEFLGRKLQEKGIDCHRNGDNRIYIEACGIPKFFDFIGRKSPIDCYSYKFALPEWRFEAKTMREVADELKIDYNKLSYWVKIGRVPCMRENEDAKPRFLKEHIEQIKVLC